MTTRRQLLKALGLGAGAMAIPAVAQGKSHKNPPPTTKAGQYMRVTVTDPNVDIVVGRTARFRIPFDTVVRHDNDPDNNLRLDNGGIYINETGLYQVNGGIAFKNENGLTQHRQFAIMTATGDERFPLVQVIDQTSDLVEAHDAALAASTLFSGNGRLICWTLTDLFVHTEPDQFEAIAPIAQSFLEVGRIA